MKVSGLKIDEILLGCSDGTYKIPAFQRDFVWSPSQICGYVESALQGLPCGGIVTWENTNNFKDAEVIKIVQIEGGKKKYVEFPPKGKQYRKVINGNKHVVDGMQRLTATCIAFGGLKNVHVISEGSVIPWLIASKFVIHNGCTTAIESFLLEKHVISYRPYVDALYDLDVPNKISLQVFIKDWRIEYKYYEN